MENRVIYGNPDEIHMSNHINIFIYLCSIGIQPSTYSLEKMGVYIYIKIMSLYIFIYTVWELHKKIIYVQIVLLYMFIILYISVYIHTMGMSKIGYIYRI